MGASKSRKPESGIGMGKGARTRTGTGNRDGTGTIIVKGNQYKNKDIINLNIV